MTQRHIFRILDANFNRSREGLRVCEELARFVLNDAPLTRKLKTCRHATSKVLLNMPVPYSKLLDARNSASDVGRAPSPLEKKRCNAADLFSANSQRVKESLRVLEEALKLGWPHSADSIKRIRFNVYEIERNALPKLETLRHHRR